MGQSIAHFDERTHTFERATPKTLESMRNSLSIIREALRPVIEKISIDEALSKYGAFSGRMQEPLTANDYLILSTAQRAKVLGRNFSYADVQDLIWEMNGKTMNTQSIYNSLRRLLSNNLIKEASDAQSVAQEFQITSFGSDVMAISLINEEVRYEAILAKQ